MDTFDDYSAQGDLLIMRVDALPDGLVKQTPESNGHHIVAHSETNHHHVVASQYVDMYKAANDEMTMYLVVNKTTALEHLRSFDTHAPIGFKEGIFKLKRQREHTPEGWRRVAD